MPSEHSHFFFARDALSPDLESWLNTWREQSPDMGLFAMVAEQDATQVAVLQLVCRNKNIPLTGGIFPQLIWDNDLQPNGLLVYCMPCNPATLLLGDINTADGQIREDAIEALTDFADAAPPDSRLLTVFDGLVPNISSIMERIYATLGDKLVYVGIAAGSETFQPLPCLFDHEKLTGNGVLAMRLNPAINALIECDYSVPDELIPTTSSSGNRIQQINWRPAFDVYAEMVERHYQVRISKDNFYQHAVHFPFGIIRADGEVLVRIPVALLDDGSLLCVGEIPSNALLTVVNAITPGSALSVDKLSGQLKQQPGLQGLIYYCAGRRMHLGDAALQEIRSLNRALAPGVVGGALTLGEIGSASASHYPLFYNAAIVAIPGLCV